MTDIDIVSKNGIRVVKEQVKSENNDNGRNRTGNAGWEGFEKAFVNASLKLCEEGRFDKLEQFLKMASKLIKNGNATVNNAIVSLYPFEING